MDKDKLFVVEGASEALIANNMATRSGRRLHLAKRFARFNRNNWDSDIRTLCNLIVFTFKDNYDKEAKADCKNCLNLV